MHDLGKQPVDFILLYNNHLMPRNDLLAGYTCSGRVGFYMSLRQLLCQNLILIKLSIVFGRIRKDKLVEIQFYQYVKFYQYVQTY